MKKKAQIEDIIVFFALIIIIFSALIYYFYFKTGTVPVLRPRKEIKPAEKSIIPPGTFFPEKKEEKKLPFILFKTTYAQVLKPQIGISLKPNKNIETYISHKYKNLINIEDNKINFKLNAKNIENPNDKFYFAYLILPINKNWQILKSENLVLELPKKQQYYILIVTAINSKNEYDPTPLSLIFRTNISNYFKDVKITSISKGELIKLKNFSSQEIDISDWRIVSSLVNFLLPQAVKFVDPYKFYKRENIILKPGEEIKIIASSSPLGINFKANKCFNYFLPIYSNLKNVLEKTNFFCDKLSKEELFELHKSGYSLNCILTLEKAGCTGLSEKDLQQIKGDLKCLNFALSKWSYKNCYENNKDKNDFLLPIWYVFLPVKSLYLPRYEEIKLLDKNGLLVDKYIIY